MCSLVTSIFLYVCESWTLTAELRRKIQAMEMRCYRKILHISYKDHVTNEEVRAKIQQAIGPQDDLLTIVKRHKLQWNGYVSRSSGLAKAILQGTVKGGRRQGRQRKRWEDNIREWTGLEFGRSQRAVENEEKWRKLVAKSSVVLQWPSCLRDRWWWWWWSWLLWGEVHKTCSLCSFSWISKAQSLSSWKCWSVGHMYPTRPQMLRIISHVLDSVLHRFCSDEKKKKEGRL